MSDPSGGRRRFPLVLGSGAVVVIAVVAIAIGVNGASSPLAPTPEPDADRGSAHPERDPVTNAVADRRSDDPLR